MKDLFSTQASQYARFRPHYPEELYRFLLANVPQRDLVWDCATGSGQAALRLAQDFERVEATDMSASQIANATAAPNIRYSVTPAEKTPFPDRHFDLVTVAQALHWFNFDAFFAEVKRVAKPGAYFAAWTYDICDAPPAIRALFEDFYYQEIHPWFDPERAHIDDRYGSIPFPFEMVDAPLFYEVVHWRKAHVAGFIESWSAVQHYKKANGGQSPVPAFMEKLDGVWPDDVEMQEFRFPLTLKLGRV